MKNRKVISFSLNELELEMFEELKAHIFKNYYEEYMNFTNSDFLKHLIRHEHYIYNMIKEESKNNKREIES